MQHRQRHSGGYQQLIQQISYHFRLSQEVENTTNAFPEWVFLTQAMQSICLKAQVEFYRRNKAQTPGSPQTMGSIYWQLNDIWPGAISWSSIEYSGRWKMAQYFAKNFYSPILVSSFEDPGTDNYHVHVTSDVNQVVSGTVVINLWSYTGQALNTWSVSFSLAALETNDFYDNTINTMMSGKCSSRADCFIQLLCFTNDNTIVSENHYYLTSIANVTLSNPSITITNVQQLTSQTATVTLSSSSVAPYTWISTSIPGHFSDNAFILYTNIPKVVTFYGTVAFSSNYLQSTLLVMSVYDTLS